MRWPASLTGGCRTAPGLHSGARFACKKHRAAESTLLYMLRSGASLREAHSDLDPGLQRRQPARHAAHAGKRVTCPGRPNTRAPHAVRLTGACPSAADCSPAPRQRHEQPAPPAPHRSPAWDPVLRAARLHHAGHVARGALRRGGCAVGQVAALVRVAPVDGRRQRGRVGGPQVVGHQRVGRRRADLVELDQRGGQHAQQRCAARAPPVRQALPSPNLDQRGGQHAQQRCAAPPRPHVRP
jgi:hypothetical protein